MTQRIISTIWFGKKIVSKSTQRLTFVRVDVGERAHIHSGRALYNEGVGGVQVHAPGDKQHILGLLIVKELVLLDPDDKVRSSRRSTYVYGHCFGTIAVRV